MRPVNLVVSLLSAAGLVWAQAAIDEGFEGMLPDFHTYQGTYAADAVTPTLVLWHYPFYNRGGESSCGYPLGKPTLASRVMDILVATPNVVATLNGHTHYNSLDLYQGSACSQNASYAEWPNLYRVFRV